MKSNKKIFYFIYLIIFLLVIFIFYYFFKFLKRKNNMGIIESFKAPYCRPHYQLMTDPNIPSTKACYISLPDYKRFYNPEAYQCPQTLNYNTKINNIEYCRDSPSNVPNNKE